MPAEMRTFLDPPPRGAPGSGDGPRRAVGSRSIAAVGEGDRRARARVGAGAGAAAPPRRRHPIRRLAGVEATPDRLHPHQMPQHCNSTSSTQPFNKKLKILVVGEKEEKMGERKKRRGNEDGS